MTGTSHPDNDPLARADALAKFLARYHPASDAEVVHDLAAEVSRLREEVDTLRADQAPGQEGHQRVCVPLVAERDALRSRVEALEAALRKLIDPASNPTLYANAAARQMLRALLADPVEAAALAAHNPQDNTERPDDKPGSEARVVDLMQALEDSVNAAKAARDRKLADDKAKREQPGAPLLACGHPDTTPEVHHDHEGQPSCVDCCDTCSPGQGT